MLGMDDLVKGLRSLGVDAGMGLEVHSSLSSFGRVEHGAAMVIEALQACVTPQGAVVMPAFRLSKLLALSEAERARGLLRKIRILEPDSVEPSGMGVIADHFRRLPGVVTGEGVFRVSAWGAEAERHAQEGFTYLHACDAYGLLLGVDIYSLSSMHYVEGEMPVAIRQIFEPPAEVARDYPPEQWLVETGEAPVKAWYKIQDQAFARGMIREAKIGNARCMLFKLNEVIGLYREALASDPLGLYGLS